MNTIGATWLSAFIDVAAASAEQTFEFWSAVTGYPLSTARGADREFATLVPPQGQDYLRVQRLASGPSRIHLDLHVPDPRSAADRAVAAGAVEVADHGYVVLTSPGGLTWCLVGLPDSEEWPAYPTWPGGHSSQVYQVCLDLPPERFDDEVAFWTDLLAAPYAEFTPRPEFGWLQLPRSLGLNLLIQRLQDDEGPVRAHLDLGTDDRPAELERHRALGAEVVAEQAFWSVLRDPAGLAYCITDRDPATGALVT